MTNDAFFFLNIEKWMSAKCTSYVRTCRMGVSKFNFYFSAQ